MFLKIQKFFSLIVLAAGMWCSEVVAAPNDFDNDGVSDLIFVTTATGGERTWKIVPSLTPNAPATRVFAISADALAPSFWLFANTPALGLVRANSTERSMVWKALVSDSVAKEEKFGRLGSLALSGADFDGNGIGDAATVVSRSGKVRWSVRLNLFQLPASRTKSFSLGKNGARAFYMNPDGTEDWAGIIERRSASYSQVVLRNLVTNKTKSYRKLPRSLTRGSRPRPIPIADSTGKDMLGFVTQDGADTTLSVYRLDGTKVSTVTIVGIATVITGEFDLSDPGEEAVFQVGTQLRIYNPLSGTITQQTGLSGTLVGSFSATTVG